MTDYFALLEQPRRPWLDAEELKQTFHAKTLREHPDAQPKVESSFAKLNEAYQVLRDPKRRLQHLLDLEAAAPSSLSNSIPPKIEELFPAIADLTHQSDALLQKFNRADSTLSRSLLKAEIISASHRIDDTLKKLEGLRDEAQTRLQQVSDVYENSGQKYHAELQAMYLRFSYLTKWNAQLGERKLQLTAMT